MSHTCYVFDAYGTLFDVHSAVARHADLVGPDAARVSEIWRNKQLEYSWTRSGMARYRDFWTLTQEALDFALASVRDANRQARQKLLDAYMELDCYGEVPGVLRALKDRGARTAILSNGSPDMLGSAIRSAGLDDLLDATFSVHPLMVFKTSPETYRMVTDFWKVERGSVSFQSSNRWDIAGAAAFGFDCAWINRTGQPDEYADLAPSRVLTDLSGLLAD
ncbi:MAG: haloacid dehalogenase type II [Nitratireductor sp.]|nr:haloacid dehalogenase type II [Nitratireductor sp.]